MHEKTIGRIYRRELFSAIGIYTVLLVLANTFASKVDSGPLTTIVLASPMIGFGLAVWAVARQLRRIDEYQRQTTLEAIAIAAAVTAGVTFTYGFMEAAGYPRLSMFAVWPIMASAWLAVCTVRALANR